MLGSGYTAKNPSRVKKLVLAEPGMLNNAKAKEYMKKFKVEFSFNMLRYATTIAFESLHLKNDDKQAALDYIFGRITGLDVKENPMRKYFCNEDMKTAHLPSWRIGATASMEIMQKGMDKDGNIIIDLVSGIENYKDKVLFLVGECNQIIGEDFQKGHVKLFPNAEMKVIKDAGHTMLGEKPKESMRIIREYFKEE